MISSLNYCARLQIELARLRIFTHALTSRVTVDETSVKGAESFLDSIYVKLRPAKLEQAWVYPRLLQSLAEAFEQFPLEMLYQKSGYDEYDARILASVFTQQAGQFKDLAKQVAHKKVTTVLLELARYIRASVGVGARTDESLYNEIARLFPDKELQLEVRQQMNRWAVRTQDSLNARASELLSELLEVCPHLNPSQHILEDLLERMEYLVYVPLVFDEGRIGVSVPVKIIANFHQREAEPHFRVMGREDVENPKWLQVRPNFIEAVKRGRTRAAKLLSKRGRKVEHPEFSIIIELPDLRIHRSDSESESFYDQALIYDQGSIEYPVALALFPQHPRLKQNTPLNPEVMTTGPIEEDSLEPKYQALKTVGRAQVLLATSYKQIYPADNRSVRSLRVNNDAAIIEQYFTAVPGHAQIWKVLNRQHPKILPLKDARWDAPLKLGEKAGPRTPPLIPTIKRHQRGLSEEFRRARAVQLQGLSGIGKTYLLAQWLMQVQERYDLVIYTSIPNYPVDDKAMPEWVTGVFEELAYQLNYAWGRPELLQKFTTQPSLIGMPSDLVKALAECLADARVLWVIDHGESLLNEDFRIAEARFASLISAITYGELDSCKLLFVTNRRLERPIDLVSYELNDGFTFEEACEYLSPNVWRFPELREEVATVLGNHPRALALLVGHAGDYSIHQAEVEDLLQSLPAKQGEIDLREVVCNKILGHVVGYLKSELPETWWTLLLASTFLEGFSAKQFGHLKQALPSKVTIFDFYRELSNLARRSLLSYSEGKWWTHALVRGYVQDIFSKQYPKQHKLAHQKAGETYFPLTKEGHAISTPLGHVRSLYADASGCATALYHYETADYEKGQQAILGNYYEHLIPKALWWMSHRSQPNPAYGFMRAENILRKILKVNATKGEDDKYPGSKEVSYDINRLMAKALYRQRNKEKYEEAAHHCREAIRKGFKESIPLLICILCDLSEGQPETNSYWLEAQQLFEELSGKVFSENYLPPGAGAAYEKIATRYFSFGDSLLAHAVVAEASERNVAWDGVYLVGAEIARSDGCYEEYIHWLEQGLGFVPQSSRLWKHYFLLKARAGELNTLTEALRYHPRGVGTAISLCQSLLDEGFDQAAIQVLSDAVKYYGDHFTLLTYYAQVLRQTGAVKEAINIYERLIKIAPLQHEPYHLLGNLYFSLDDPASALVTFNRGCKFTSNGILYTALGQYYEEQGQLDTAEAVYLKGTSADTNSSQAYWMLGQLYEKQNRLDLAEEVYHKSISLEPKTNYLWIGLGRLYEKQNRLDLAEDAYRKGISACPTYVPPYQLLGQLYERQGQSNRTEELYKEGISTSHQNIDFYRLLGELYEKQGEIGKAEAIYLKGISEVTPDATIHLALGELYEKQGEIGKAEAIYLKGIAKDRNGAVHFSLGRFYTNQGQADKAEEILLKGISAFPSFSCYSVLGRLYEKQGRLDQAEKIYLKGISVSGSHPNTYIDLGGLYENQGRSVEAEEVYLKGISALPNAYSLYSELGKLYEKQGQLSKTQAIYLQGISAVPNGYSLYFELGEFYEKQGRLDEAEGIYLKGASNMLDSGNFFEKLGKVYEIQGWPEKAEEIYRKGILSVPKFDGNVIALSQLYEKQGQLDKAENVLLEGISMIPTSFNPYISLGEFYEKQGKLNRAEEVLLQCVVMVPTCYNGYAALGKFYQRHDQLDKAEEYLQRGLSATMYRGPVQAELEELHQLKETAPRQELKR